MVVVKGVRVIIGQMQSYADGFLTLGAETTSE